MMSILLIYALLFAVFFSWAIYAPHSMRWVVEGTCWFFGAWLAIEVIFGCMMLANEEPWLVAAHYWIGHLLVVIVWALTGASFALVIRHFRKSRGTAILFCLVSIAALAIVMLASFTADLDAFAPDADKETTARFLGLHAIAPQALLAILVPIEIAVARTLPQAPRKTESREDPTSLPPPSDNPYAAPRGR